ncbi:MAG: hypothetical protein ACXAC7_11905 [Candidatus Hodarchaeales archaeon]
MSKSRQFTKDMDIIGEIKEEGKGNGSIGIRKDIEEERLVIKAFSKSMNWIGTMEESVSREVIHSHVLGHQFPSFILIIPKYEYLVVLEKNEGGLGKKEKFHFTVFDKEREAQWFMLEKQRVSAGDDWDIKNMQGKVVGKVDGKMMDIGGQWDVQFYSEPLSKNKAFVMSLILFAVSRRYSDDIEERIENIIKNAKKGKKYLIDKNEITLYENPRSLRS